MAHTGYAYGAHRSIEKDVARREGIAKKVSLRPIHSRPHREIFTFVIDLCVVVQNIAE